MKRVIPVAILFAVALSLSGLCSDASAAVLTGRLSNFDLKNFSGGQATDLDMIISGITCSDISYYFGQASGLMNMNCQNVGGGKIRVTFSGGSTFPVANGQWRHFGLQFSTGATPHVEQIFWTSGGVQLGSYIDFAGLSWTGTVDCPVHMEISRADSLGPPPYVQVVDARWSTRPYIVPLDDMVRGNPTWENSLWMDANSLEGTLTTASDVLDFWTPALDPGGDPAVMSRYVLLSNTGDTLGYYFEQVSIVGPRVPALSHWAVLVALLCVLAVVTLALLRRRASISASRA